MNVSQNQSGLSIIAVVATMLILSVMGVTLISLVTTGSDISVNQLRSEQAFNIAQGGIEYGLYTTTRGGGSWGEFTFADRPLGAGAFTMTTNTSIVGGRRRMTLDSTGTVTGSVAAQRSIQVFVSGGDWPDGNCPPKKNEGTVSIVSNALSIATNTGKKKGMDDCRVQTLAASIPPSTNIVLSLNYKFDSNYACSSSSSNSTAKCLMSIVFIYSDSTTETPWTNSIYPSAWTGSGNILWMTKAGVDLTAIRLKYDIESANQNNAQTTGWLDDVSLVSSGTIVNWQEIY